MRDTDVLVEHGDALTRAFWDAAVRRVLVLQRCDRCNAHQFYPRPFCLSCGGTSLQWAEATGTGTVYSLTTVHMSIRPDLPAPYVVALIDLDEGPRLLTHLVGPECRIGDRVRVAWRTRDGLPPLPVFTPVTDSHGGQ